MRCAIVGEVVGPANCVPLTRGGAFAKGVNRPVCMTPNHIREIQTNEVLRKRLAKFLALHCFRNTELENLHSGAAPISESGDYSDVKVITPAGEIPWTRLSRFDNNEMKALMIDVVNHCDRLLAIIFSTPVGDELIDELGRRDLVPEWNDPECTWEAGHEAQLARYAPGRGLIAKRNLKRKKADSARGRSVGRN